LEREIGKLFSYAINPISWLLIAIAVYYLMSINVPKRYKYEKNMKEWLFISVSIFIIVYFSIGLFTGFGVNPYNRSLNGILLNLWSFGSIILAQEYIRYIIININRKSDRLLVNICLITILVIADLNLLNFMGYFKNELAILRFLATILVPKIIENILLTYTATKGGLVPNIIYKLVISIAIWVTPILPNCNWLVLSLLYCIFPFLTYMIINYLILKRENHIPARLTKGISPQSMVFNFIVIIIAITFVLGVTPFIPTAIVTESMHPKIKVGDVVITKKMAIDKIEVGDIVHVKRNDYYVIHRVIEKKMTQGQIQLITKGDNNKTKDYSPVTNEQVVGKVVLIIPKIGYPSYWLNKTIRALKDGSNV
jgi:signal peptidase